MKSNKMIDIIIPTMWKSENFLNHIRKYIDNPYIKKIIIIDNNYKKRPKFDFNNEKIKLFKFTYNIFVNPAWNFGVSISESEIICLGSDDFFIEEDVFSFVSNLNFENIGIIGSFLTNVKLELKLEKISFDKKLFLGDQHYGFGCFMFIERKKYVPIPSLYKIWFGDDFLVRNLYPAYSVPILFDKDNTLVSVTLNNFTDKKKLKKRLDLDVMNAKKMMNSHFKFKI